MNKAAGSLIRIMLCATLALSLPQAVAKPNNSGDGCLSNLEINLLAKEKLPYLQSIDPNVSLGNVKLVINSVGDCVTLEAANLAVDAYAASLSPNAAPTISGVPNTDVAEGESYAFTPLAADEDGDSLQFSIQNAPHWSVFDSQNGSLAGAPGYSDAGFYTDIVISVSDGSDSVSLDPFTIEVLNTNRAPTIGGTPATKATIDEIYSFLPTASDPDDDLLSFLIQNKPPWANFDGATGELSGTPTQVGIYTGIVISVSDGFLEVALNELDITVEDASVVGSTANLSWQYPTTRIDGSFLPMNEIAGYRIYMGPTQETLAMIVDLYDGAANTYAVTELTAGTYYFGVTTYDINGLESGYSNLVSIDI